MLRLIYTKKGMGMIEVLIAVFLTTVGILALIDLQPSAIRAAAQSDYLGRASGILNKTFENYETIIVNPCCVVVPGMQLPRAVQVSGESASYAGDMTFTVNTTILADDVATSAGTEAFVVTVRVTWPANPVNGISESRGLTRHDLNRFPEGCLNNSNALCAAN